MLEKWRLKLRSLFSLLAGLNAIPEVVGASLKRVSGLEQLFHALSDSEMHDSG